MKAISNGKDDPLLAEIKNVMTPSVKKCKKNDQLRNVIRDMNKGHFRHIPVVDENDKMVEFISISDLVLAHLNEVEAENAAMRVRYRKHHTNQDHCLRISRNKFCKLHNSLKTPKLWRDKRLALISVEAPIISLIKM